MAKSCILLGFMRLICSLYSHKWRCTTRKGKYYYFVCDRCGEKKIDLDSVTQPDLY